MAKGKAHTPEMQAARERAQANAADAVAQILELDRRRNGRRYTDYRDISSRMGREMGRTLLAILKDGDTTVSTLSDLGHVCGQELVISYVDKPRPR